MSQRQDFNSNQSGEITPIVEPHLLVNTNAPSAGHMVPCPKVQNSGEEQ